jgi:hypothetical protein
VPSVEPVSAITHESMKGRTEARQRRITGASSFTIMPRQMVESWAFIVLSGRSFGLARGASRPCVDGPLVRP